MRTALLGITGHSYLDKLLSFGPVPALMTALLWLATGALNNGRRRPGPAGTAIALA